MFPVKIAVQRGISRHCLLFMFNLGKSASEAKATICQAYGENSIGLSTVKECYAKFRKGEFKLKDKPRSGRPREIEEEIIQQLLEEDDSMSTRKLDEILKCDHTTVLRRLRAMDKVKQS